METARATDCRLWIGTYPGNGIPGSGEGIWRVVVDPHAGRFAEARLVVPASAPSFIALHPHGHMLYAVAEGEPGLVRAFAVDGDFLSPRGTPLPSDGTFPCHVLATSDQVWIANYGNGVFHIHELTEEGDLGEAGRSFVSAGSGPDASRQEGPHAHFVLRVGEQALVIDLGTDSVRGYHVPRFRPQAQLPSASTSGAPAGDVVRLAASFPPGTGPRHGVELGGGYLAIVAELDPAVFVLAPGDDGMYTVVARYPACATEPVSGPDRRNYPSHLVLSDDGSRLYVGVRGADVVSAFAVDRGAASGRPGPAPTLRHLSDTPTGGQWPRHLALLDAGGPSGSGDLIVVADQESGDLALLEIDRETGQGSVLDSLPLPAPACVVPSPSQA